MKNNSFIVPFEPGVRKPLVYNRLFAVPERADIVLYTFPGWDSPDFFGNANPVVVEYCSGNGSWIAERAEKMPELNFLAVEMRFDRAKKIWKKILSRNIPNLIVLWGEALNATKFYFPSQSVSEVFINFPDPWPKRRHFKHRLIAPPLLDELARTLNVGATVHITTDDEAYSEELLKVFGNDRRFKATLPSPYYTEPPADYGISFFHDLFQGQQKPIRYHRYKKG